MKGGDDEGPSFQGAGTGRGGPTELLVSGCKGWGPQEPGSLGRKVGCSKLRSKCCLRKSRWLWAVSLGRVGPFLLTEERAVVQAELVAIDQDVFYL